jgi:NAD(P)-dependent dehydrogenase (short-subunit alcohol dehydrogenase family)
LITGASRGIGRAVALRFAREGADLVLVARTQAALEEVDDEVRQFAGKASLVPGDLTDFSLIDRIGGAIFERWRRLDVLVGNAAELGILGPLAEVPPANWERLIALNLTANWRLIRAFDPLLRRSPAGRAIFVTADAGRARAYWGAYAVSKAALEAMVKIYAAEIRKTAVRTNLIDPGPTRTRLRAHAYPGEDEAQVKPPEAVTDAFVELADAACTRNGEVVAV